MQHVVGSPRSHHISLESLDRMLSEKLMKLILCRFSLDIFDFINIAILSIDALQIPTEKKTIQETSPPDENTDHQWKNFSGNATKISKNLKPYEEPVLPYQGEYHGEEQVMKAMGLPLSFVRSPRDFEEVNIILGQCIEIHTPVEDLP